MVEVTISTSTQNITGLVILRGEDFIKEYDDGNCSFEEIGRKLDKELKKNDAWLEFNLEYILGISIVWNI